MSHLSVSLIQTESAIFKLWILYFQRAPFSYYVEREKFPHLPNYFIWVLRSFSITSFISRQTKYAQFLKGCIFKTIACRDKICILKSGNILG